jgi:hypothetical protein
VNALDPQVVLGIFTYDDNDASQHHREIDIEYSRWGNPDAKAAGQFVVQPPGKDSWPRIDVTDRTPSTESFTWLPDSVAFVASNGSPTDGDLQRRQGAIARRGDVGHQPLARKEASRHRTAKRQRS